MPLRWWLIYSYDAIMKWYENVKKMMKSAKVVQDNLIPVLGVDTRGAVSHYLTGRREPSIDQLKALAVFFNVSLDELLSDDDVEASNLISVAIPDRNFYPADKAGSIPLISWVSAGMWCETIDNFNPGDAEAWVDYYKSHGKHTYALRVDGDSMTSPFPGAKSYPHGTIIIVDPDREITNHCRVIAKIPDTDEATFKEYSYDAGKHYLKPLNPRYPIYEITDKTIICGVVIGALIDE